MSWDLTGCNEWSPCRVRLCCCTGSWRRTVWAEVRFAYRYVCWIKIQHPGRAWFVRVNAVLASSDFRWKFIGFRGLVLLRQLSWSRRQAQKLWSQSSRDVKRSTSVRVFMHNQIGFCFQAAFACFYSWRRWLSVWNNSFCWRLWDLQCARLFVPLFSQTVRSVWRQPSCLVFQFYSPGSGISKTILHKQKE